MISTEKEASAMPRDPSLDRLTVLGIYAWSTFWAIAEGKGSPSFYLSPKAFVNAGHRMVIVQPRGEHPAGPAEYHGIELVRYRGGPRTVIEDPSRGRLARFFTRHAVYWRYQAAALVAGIRACRRIRPDVIVAYGDYSVPVVWVLGRLFRRPTVNRLFGTFLARYLGRGPVTPLALSYHYIHALALRIPAKRTVLCDDGSQGDRVAAALGVERARFRFWRNGANHHVYEPSADVAALRRRLGLPVEAILLFTVSRLHPEKHIERILAALPLVVARHPSVRFVVIGSGPEEPFLRREAHRLEVEPTIVWTGALEREELAAYLNACDVFVAMSDRTNAANPLFEAALCARPPVVLDTGGTSDAVTHGHNGWLVPEDHPEALGPLLVEILSDLDNVRAVGARSLEWARAHVPSYEERQRMEVAVVVEAVAEARARARGADAVRRAG